MNLFKPKFLSLLLVGVTLFTSACFAQKEADQDAGANIESIAKLTPPDNYGKPWPTLTPIAFADSALQRTTVPIIYDGMYVGLKYPWGDVPGNIGVCTDVVIRTYRKFGIDLQKLVHEDMRANFAKYPSKRTWGLKRPDKNIDHRRVLNLEVFFKRHGTTLPTSLFKEDYKPGDLVTWLIGGDLPHIGIVSNIKDPQSGRYKIIHNIGGGPVIEDVLFEFDITGHFRFYPKKSQ